LGNIAYRAAASIEIDAATGHLKDRSLAETYWHSDDREGWVPLV
jgi:hypothetical protein